MSSKAFKAQVESTSSLPLSFLLKMCTVCGPGIAGLLVYMVGCAGPLGYILVLLTSAKSPRVLANYRGKVIDRKEDYTQARRHKSKVCGFKTQCQIKDFSFGKVLFSFLFKEFVNFISVSWFSGVNLWKMWPQICIKDLFIRTPSVLVWMPDVKKTLTNRSHRSRSTKRIEESCFAFNWNNFCWRQ